MGYQLWYDDYIKVNSYLRNKQKNIYPYLYKCKPLKLNSSDQNEKKYSIKQIDSITCNYKNEEEFIQDLKKIPENRIFDNQDYSLILTSEYRGKIRNQQVIYNDKLLQYYASSTQNKQKLDITPKLQEFIDYIKILATNSTTSSYLLNPYNVTDISEYDQVSLDLALGKDITKFGDNNTIVKPSLRTLLRHYNGLISSLNLGEEQENIMEDIRRIEKQIQNYFTDSYKNLREAIIWEKIYRDVLEKSFENTTDEVKRIVLTSQINQVDSEINYRNGISDNHFKGDVLSYSDAEAIYLSKCDNDAKYQEITNPKMKELYEWGGIDAVREYMDIDEIYQNGLDDAIAIGLIPSNYKEKNSKVKKIVY